MKELRKVFAVTKVSLAQYVSGARVPCMTVLTLICLFYLTEGIVSYAVESDYALTPWLLPFLFTRREERLILYGIGLLLVCDSAKKDRTYIYQIIRTGSLTYTWGKIIHLITVTFGYTLFLAVAVIIIRISHITFYMDWGKVLGTYTNPLEHLENGLVGSENIVQHLTVAEGMVAGFALIWGSFLLIGLVVYLVELLSRNSNLAVLTGGAFLIGDYFAHSARSVDWSMFRWIFPLCWSNLERMRLNRYYHGPTIGYAMVMMTVVLLILIIAIVAVVLVQKGVRKNGRKDNSD